MTIKTYDTVTLIGAIRGLPRFEPFLTSLFFPKTQLFDTEFIAFDDIAEDHRLAPFVSPIEAGQVMRDRGSVLKVFKPAYVKPKHIVDHQRVLERVPGEGVGGAMDAGSRRNAVIADNLRMERNSIRFREEWMAASALLTGKVIVAGEKHPSTEVDFGRDASLTKVLSGVKLWTDFDSTPLEDIEDWAEELVAPSADIVFGRHAWDAFKRHPDVIGDRGLLDTRVRGSESSLEIGAGNNSWYEFKGYLSGVVRVWVLSATYEDDAGQDIPYLPADHVIMGSSHLGGVRCFGAIRDGAANYRALELFPRHWTGDDPGVEYTMTQSAPLLVPTRPNASMAAKVV